jgi:transcription-repair coupling factor (superfamily II helicase)
MLSASPDATNWNGVDDSHPMLSGLLSLLQESGPYAAIRAAVRAPRPAWIQGPSGAEKGYVLAALLADPAVGAQTVLIVTPTRDAAGRLADDLALFAPDLHDRTILWPSWDGLASADRPVSLEAVVGWRAVLERLTTGTPSVVVVPASALLQRLPTPESLAAERRLIHRGDHLERETFLEVLTDYGYDRLPLVEEPGQMAVRGGVIDLFPPGGVAYRIELLGDEVESLREFDPATQRSLRDVDEIGVLPLRTPGDASDGAAQLFDFLPSGALVILDEEPELVAQARVLRELDDHEAGERYHAWEVVASALGDRRLVISTLRGAVPPYDEIPLRFGGMEAFGGQTNLLARSMREWIAAGRRVIVASAHPLRVGEILREHGLEVPSVETLAALPSPGTVTAVAAPLSGGFVFEPAALAVLTDSEILGWRRRRGRLRFVRGGRRLSSWIDLKPGDYVVHFHHGIARYGGLTHLTMNGSERDYLLLEYAQEDRLYVPVDQIALVDRYIGVEGEAPKIHTLGGAEWEREKARVKESARALAGELLSLYAARQAAAGHAFSPDTPWQRELEATFQFEETPDQWQAIQDVKRDMEADRPMDRLIAGDVGYGKTEVAIRAAFKAVMDGKQAAVLVPTTILAQQHYDVFLQRLAPYPIKVEVLSRFRTRREQQRILREVAEGQVDVVIGTHRLLGKDVHFRDLGLVIIDEEQRFGVEHKERLKQLRKQVDVLTLTATPIPRTLHMSLVGLRDMSVMETPPEDRLPIHTEIREQDEDVIREAILRELARGGQIYVVHNRVQTIDRAARAISRLVPEARVVVAHGQMPEEKLERVMMDFLGGRYDVLVCTTIVEIGLDIPQVNTVIIQDAHLMGLAQLYQLRGRVGRAERQAYCYLLYPRGEKLTPEAEQRLEAMQEFVELGSGMKLAMRDLEIRGAGNLLGPEQHGQLAAVGFDLYVRLLDQAIRELRGEIVDDAPDPTIDVHVDAYIPPEYVSDDAQRMTLYRRLGATQTLEVLEGLIEEIEDRYGPAPAPLAHLLGAVRLRTLGKRVGASAVTREGPQYTIRLRAGAYLPEAVQRRLRVAYGTRLQVTPATVTVRTSGVQFADQVAEVRDVLEALAHYVRQPEEEPVPAH